MISQVWFSLSVGRKHTAEARWLLPAIIRAGDLSKSDVGAIKIKESQTYFEITFMLVDEEYVQVEICHESLDQIQEAQYVHELWLFMKEQKKRTAQN